MPIYSVQGPDGRIYDVEGPAGASDDQVIGALQAHLKSQPAAPSTERTWGQAAKDVGAGLVSGAGSLVELPGQLYGLATGNFEPTGALGAGQAISKYGEEMKSPGLKAREAASQKVVQAAEESGGQLAAFVAQAKELITDPAQLSTFLAAQLPQLAVPGGAAKGAAALAMRRALAAGATETAAKAAAIAAGTAAAKGAGAVQQGADIGAGSYKELYDAMVKKGEDPKVAADKALTLARASGVSAAGISLIAQNLPGASALEAKFAGKAGSGRLATGLGETVGEIAEEAPAKVVQNLAMQQVNPNQALMQGVGATAAQAGIGGGLAGTVLGGRGKETPTASPFATTAPETAEAPVVPTAPVAAAPAPTPLAERPYTELAKEVARISELADRKEATPAEMAELKTIRQELTDRGVRELQDQRAAAAEAEKAKAKEAAVAQKFPGLATAEPDLFGEIHPPSAPVAEEEAPVGLRDVIAAELPATTEVLADAGIAPTAKELEAAGQQRLDLRRTPAGQPTAPVAEPTKRVAPAALTPATAPAVTSPEVFGALGIGPSALIRKPGHPMLGLDISVPAQAAEVKRGLEIYREGRSEGIQKKIDEYLARPEFQDIPSEPINVKPTRTTPTAIKPTAQPGGGEPSVGVPNQPAVVGQLPAEPTGPTAPTATGEPAATVGLGLVPPKKPLGPRAEPKGKPAPALAAPAPGGMFGALVRPGATDLTEEEAAAPKAEKPKSPFDWATDRTPSAIGEALAPTVEETKSEAKARKIAEAAKRTTAKAAGIPSAPISDTDAATITKAIDTKSVLEVANWLANTPMVSADYRLIASRVANTLQELKAAGVRIGKVSVTSEGKMLTSGASGVAIYTHPTRTEASEVRIILNNHSNGSKSGVNPETILHELLHAATLATIRVGNFKSAEGTRIGKLSRDLLALHTAVVSHFNARVKSGAPLTAFERAIYKGPTNALKTTDEILAWSLTNRDMQTYMESIPYKGSNTWDKFVTLLRDMLRLPAKADTALSEIMRIGGELTSLQAKDMSSASTVTGAAMAISPESMAITEEMNARAPANETQRLKAVQFRTLVVDSMASVVERINKEFQGAIRNSQGVLNPVALMRQAADSGKFIESFLLRGGFRKDATTGLYEVYDDKNIKPPAEVFTILQDLATKYSMPLKEMQRHVSVVLEGVRLHGLREEYRKAGETLRSHMTDAQINAQMASYNATPELKQISKIMDDARIQLVDQMVQVGRLTPEMGKEWREVVGYVPFERMKDIDQYFALTVKPGGKGIGQLGRLPEFVGSYTRPVGDVFQNYIDTISWMVRQVTNTDATINALETLQNMGEAKNIGPSLKASKTGHAQLAYKDGVPTYFDLPTKYDKMAFADPAPPPMGMVRLAGKVSNVLRSTVTALPPFALKQIFDDTQRAVFYSGVQNPAALIGPAFKSFFSMAASEVMGKSNPIVKKLGALGLVGEVDYHPSESAEYLTQHMGLAERTKLKEVLHRLEGITRASDLAVRNAVYEQTLKESATADMPGGDKLLAAYRARELINFRRKGSAASVGFFVSTVPFFNAYLQGTDLVYRNATGTDSSMGIDRAAAVKKFATRAAMAFGFSLMYAIAKSNDDDYNKMNLRTRNNNWIIGGGIKVPVAGELSALFKVPAEALVEYMRRQGTPEQQAATEAVNIALMYIFEQYGGRVTPIPQAIKPLMEAFWNRSTLTGRQLEGTHQKILDAHLRKSGSTSELATVIANLASKEFKLEVSPIMIDNTLDGYFGTASAMTKMMTDALLNPNKPGRPMEKWMLLSNYMYETGETAGTRPMDEFYDLNARTSSAAASMRELAKTDVNAAIQYGKDHANEIALSRSIQHQLMGLSKVREAIKVLSSANGAQAIPNKAERDARIKELQGVALKSVQGIREVKNRLGL